MALVAAQLLPDGILASILRRLAPRSLAASSCVCKSWCAVVNDWHLLRTDLLPLSLSGIFFMEEIFPALPKFFASPSIDRKIAARLNYLDTKFEGYLHIMDHCKFAMDFSCFGINWWSIQQLDNGCVCLSPPAPGWRTSPTTCALFSTPLCRPITRYFFFPKFLTCWVPRQYSRRNQNGRLLRIQYESSLQGHGHGRRGCWSGEGRPQGPLLTCSHLGLGNQSIAIPSTGKEHFMCTAKMTPLCGTHSPLKQTMTFIIGF